MSSGSDSDEDYTPGQPEQLSEEESADEETDLQFEDEKEQSKKRKAAKNAQATKGKKRRTNKQVVEKEPTPPKEVEEELHPEEEKKREEDLWAKFLEGTDTKPKAKETAPIKESPKPATVTNNTPSNSIKKKDDEKSRERRIFEFAGETIVVEDNIIKEKIKPGESPASVSKLLETVPARAPGGGLSTLVNQLNKKNKLSTLDKSKLDWATFKKVEGVEEEIESHNKGKHGYLDRRDFLERADLRQYELERDLRMSRRSNR